MPTNRLRSRAAQTLSRFSLASRGRLAVTALAASCALIAAGLPSSASAATVPPEGIFENCQLDTQMSTCLQRLQTIRSGGFQVVVFPAMNASPDSLATYAAAANSLGMKVLWQVGKSGWWEGTSVASFFAEFEPVCGCSTNSPMLTAIISFLGAQPGTYGYYAADDSMLSPGDSAAVTQYVQAIKAIDPSHPVVLSSGDESQTSEYESIGDMNAAEIYPITTGSMMPVASYQGNWSSIGQEAADDQRTANRHGKTSAFILQAFSWGDNLSDGEALGLCNPSMSQAQCWNSAIYPTASDQLQLRNEVLRHAHPAILLWASFPGTDGQAGGDTYSIYPTGSAAAAHWAGLTAAVSAPAPGTTVAHASRAKDPRHHKKRRHHRRHHHRHRHHRRHHHRKG